MSPVKTKRQKDKNISLSVITRNNEENEEVGRIILNSIVVIGNNITDITY